MAMHILYHNVYTNNTQTSLMLHYTLTTDSTVYNVLRLKHLSKAEASKHPCLNFKLIPLSARVLISEEGDRTPSYKNHEGYYPLHSKKIWTGQGNPPTPPFSLVVTPAPVVIAQQTAAINQLTQVNQTLQTAVSQQGNSVQQLSVANQTLQQTISQQGNSIQQLQEREVSLRSQITVLEDNIARMRPQLEMVPALQATVNNFVEMVRVDQAQLDKVLLALQNL